MGYLCEIPVLVWVPCCDSPDKARTRATTYMEMIVRQRSMFPSHYHIGHSDKEPVWVKELPEGGVAELVNSTTDIVAASVSLANAAREYDWFHCVGIANNSLVLYFKYQPSEFIMIANKWHGFPVRTGVLGEVSPLC